MLDRPLNGLTHHNRSDVLPEGPLSHAFPYETQKKLVITLDDSIGLAVKITGYVPYLEKKYAREYSIGDIHTDVEPDQLLEFRLGTGDVREALFRVLDILGKIPGKHLVQEVSLILEVLVDERLGYSCGTRNFRGGYGGELLVFEQRPKRVHDFESAWGRAVGPQSLSHDGMVS